MVPSLVLSSSNTRTTLHNLRAADTGSKQIDMELSYHASMFLKGTTLVPAISEHLLAPGPSLVPLGNHDKHGNIEHHRSTRAQETTSCNAAK
jgi:hypothetical protein